MFNIPKRLYSYGIEDSIIKRSGRNFLMQFPNDDFRPPILHLQGNSYQMGYDHGVLLAPQITYFIEKVCTAIYAMFGGWKAGTGTVPTRNQMDAGKNLLFGHINQNLVPAIKSIVPEFWTELEGLYAGLKSQNSPVEWDDLLFVNVSPEGTNLLFGCSNFAAWGDATVSGKLIHGVNQDLGTFGVMHKSTMVTIVNPDVGNSYMGIGWYGTISPASFINDKGLSYGEMTSSSSYVAWPQIPHFMQEKKIALEAYGIESAYEIIKTTGGTTGFNNLVCEARPTGKSRGVMIETVGNDIGKRSPDPAFPNLIYGTNHFNCYPGWQGYQGPNLVRGQINSWSKNPDLLKRKFGIGAIAWSDVDTVEKWSSLIKCHRYERYGEFLRENFGKITPDLAAEIQSDPDLSFNFVSDKVQLSPKCDHLYGLRESIWHRETFPSIYSCVLIPEDGVIYLASGDVPAQNGPYWKIEMKSHLKIMNES